MNKKTVFLFWLLGGVAVLSSCSQAKHSIDATGTFESDEVIVSAETTGKIWDLSIEEGQSLAQDQYLGCVDSMQLYYKKKQLLSSIVLAGSRRPDIEKQLSAIKEQINKAQTEKLRYEKLVKGGVSGQKPLDDIESQLVVLQKQHDALASGLAKTSQGVNGELESIQAQLDQVNDQLQKCRIINPRKGIVLLKYATKGEMLIPGKPIFKIADTEQMILRVYITGPQLSQIKIGQKIKVFVDTEQKNTKEYSGVVSWISDKAEFTPKTIQTKEEREHLVYAVKILVKNDGFLKIGMYADISLNM